MSIRGICIWKCVLVVTALTIDVQRIISVLYVTHMHHYATPSLCSICCSATRSNASSSGGLSISKQKLLQYGLDINCFIICDTRSIAASHASDLVKFSSTLIASIVRFMSTNMEQRFACVGIFNSQNMSEVALL
jgi:hypothetical protein